MQFVCESEKKTKNMPGTLKIWSKSGVWSLNYKLSKFAIFFSIFEEIERSFKAIDDVCSWTTMHNNNAFQH